MQNEASVGNIQKFSRVPVLVSLSSLHFLTFLTLSHVFVLYYNYESKRLANNLLQRRAHQTYSAVASYVYEQLGGSEDRRMRIWLSRSSEAICNGRQTPQLSEISEILPEKPWQLLQKRAPFQKTCSNY
jgi:hypothetical protein